MLTVERLIVLITKAMPVGLTTAELELAILDDDFPGDLEEKLLGLAQQTPQRLVLVDGHWRIPVTPAAPSKPQRKPAILGTARDPSEAFGAGIGGGIAMVVGPRGGRR